EGNWEVMGMRGEHHGVSPPGREPKKRANSNPAKAGGVGAFRASQAPVEITFWPRRVHLRVNPPIVRLLVNHQTLRASLDQWFVLGRLHRSQLQRNGGKHRSQGSDAIDEIIFVHELR